MKKLLLVVLSLALALSLALSTVLAESTDVDFQYMSEEELRPYIATPVLTAEHYTLPEPQDLATLFPNDQILTYTNGGISISYPSSFKLQKAWKTSAKSKWLCLFTITDDAGNTLSLYMMESDKEPVFSEDYEAYVTQALADELTRDDFAVRNLYALGFEEYYRQYYSVKTTEFGGLSGTEALVTFATLDRDIVNNIVTGGDWPHGVSLRIRLPMTTAGKGYYVFDITVPDTANREAISQCVALSSVLHTLKWPHNSEK